MSLREHLVKISSGSIERTGDVAAKPKVDDPEKLAAARKEFEQLAGKPSEGLDLEILQKEIKTLKEKV